MENRQRYSDNSNDRQRLSSTVTNTVIVNNVFAGIAYLPHSPSANGVITSQ
jgi:hypothetical protein